MPIQAVQVALPVSVPTYRPRAVVVQTVRYSTVGVREEWAPVDRSIYTGERVQDISIMALTHRMAMVVQEPMAGVVVRADTTTEILIRLSLYP
jgi:hypothetical protein